MHTRISTVVLSTLVLTACGGGGGGGSSASPEVVTISTSSSISIDENNSLSALVQATSDNSASTGISLIVSGGADAELFSFNGASLASSANFDFENPLDSNGDNVYEFQVTATSSTGVATTVPFTVEVGNIIEVSFQSATNTTVQENASFSLPITVAADGVASNDLTLAITGGADAQLFTVSNTGNSLIASQSFDFENPQDDNGDNIYELQVTATSSTGTATTALFTVEVGNVVEISFQSTTDVSVEENTPFSLPITAATDGVASNNLTLAISGGADAQLFTISDIGDSLVASQTFDFEAPMDGDADNVYEVEVSATNSSGATTSELFQVSVTNQFILSHELVFPTQNSNIAIEMTLEELQASGKTEFEAVAKLIDLEDGEVTVEEAASMFSFTINGQSLVRSTEFPDFWSATVPVVPGANNFQSVLDATANNTETQTITAFNNLLYLNPQLLDISSDGNLVYFSAGDSSGTSTLIIRFDISSGIYQLVSSDLTADGATLVSGSRNRFSVQSDTGVLDEINQRLFYMDTSDTSVNRILEVDVASGIRSQTPITFAPDTANTPAEIFGFDSSQNLIYLRDSRGVFTIDPQVGVPATIGLNTPNNLALDTFNNRILIAGSTSLDFFQIDSGMSATLFTYSDMGIDIIPEKIDVVSMSRIILTSRTGTFDVDLANSNATELVSLDLTQAGDDSIKAGSEGDIFFSVLNNSIYNLTNSKLITSLSPSGSGIYEPLSMEGGIGNFSTVFDSPSNLNSININFDNQKAYFPLQITDRRTGIASPIQFYEVNLINGNKSLLFEQEDMAGTTYSGFSTAMTFDDSRENIYFIDSIQENLYILNLDSLVVSFVSRLSADFANSFNISKIVKVENEESLLFSSFDEPTPGIYKLDIESGEIVAISTQPSFRNPTDSDILTGSGIPFGVPLDFMFDSENSNEVLVLDFDRIISVDLTSGARTIFGGVFDDEIIDLEPRFFVRLDAERFAMVTQEFSASFFEYNASTNNFSFSFGSPYASPFAGQVFGNEGFSFNEEKQIYYLYGEHSVFIPALFAFSPVNGEYIGISY
ncbi:hypothetical protein [Sessilibacter sp. MAH4]